MAASLRFQDVAKATVDELVNGHCVDIALVVDPQAKLRQILCCVPPDLHPALLAVKPRIMAGTIEAFVSGNVSEWKPLMRAQSGECDDVALRPHAALDRSPKLKKHAGRGLVRICDLDRIVDFEVLDVAELCGWIVDARQSRCRLGFITGNGGGYSACSGDRASS